MATNTRGFVKKIVNRYSHSHPYPRLRSFMGRLYRLARFVWLKYFLGIISLSLLAYGFTQNHTINIVSAVISVAGIFITSKLWLADMRRYYVWPLSPIESQAIRVSGNMAESGYDIVPRPGEHGHALITSDRINHALLYGASSTLNIEKDEFHAQHHPSEVGNVILREHRKKRAILFNDKKIRIKSEPMIDENGSITPARIQLTSYFDTLLTNDAHDMSVNYGVNQNKIFDGRDFCFRDNTVPECSVSQCSNHMGMSTIAITSDHNIVIVGQKEGNVFSQRKWAPSGSGSADWKKDLRDFDDLQEFVKYAAKRELTEECKLDVDDVAWIRLIGYGRMLERGGLPQFFCLAKLNCSSVGISGPERQFVEFHDRIYFDQQLPQREVIDKVRQELLDKSYIVSSPLWYCVELLARMPDVDLEAAFSTP
jgi:hypothetical protein